MNLLNSESDAPLKALEPILYTVAKHAHLDLVSLPGEYSFFAAAGQREWIPPEGVRILPGTIQVFVNGSRWNRFDLYDDSTEDKIAFVRPLTMGFEVAIVIWQPNTLLINIDFTRELATGPLVKDAGLLGFRGTSRASNEVGALSLKASREGADLIAHRDYTLAEVGNTLTGSCYIWSEDYANLQIAVDTAISTGKRLAIAPGTSFGQVIVNGKVAIEAHGTVICNYDGLNGPWINVAANAEGSSLFFRDIDFAGHGVVGILLNASKCNVVVQLARNQVAQPYALANRQGVVVSQGADNFIDVYARDFSMGETQGANAVPRIVTTDGGSLRNILRIRAYQVHTVWVENGIDNTAEFIIADHVTDNGIYNLPGSVGMKCQYLQYTNSHDEAFVLEGVRPWIGKAVYDGWSYPGFQNVTGAVIDEIVVLPPPDGAHSSSTLRTREGNTQSDVRIGRLTASIHISNITRYALGTFLQLYVGNIDIWINKIDLRVKWLADSSTQFLVIHRQGSIAEFGDVRISLDDTEGQAQPMYWQYPPSARVSFGSLDIDERDYPWLKFSNVTSGLVRMPRGQELHGDVVQNPSHLYPTVRSFCATSAPNSGDWNRGDFVSNKAPIIGGSTGWVCVASGKPGTWTIAGQAGVGRGGTSSRPNAAVMGVIADTQWAGTRYFDTGLAVGGKPIQWTGAAWVDSAGSIV